MTQEEINQLQEKFNVKDPLWLKAFNEYNEGREYKLSLACRSCYLKVLQWHKEKLKISVS